MPKSYFKLHHIWVSSIYNALEVDRSQICVLARTLPLRYGTAIKVKFNVNQHKIT
jgi:hypothetical protein